MWLWGVGNNPPQVLFLTRTVFPIERLLSNGSLLICCRLSWVVKSLLLVTLTGLRRETDHAAPPNRKEWRYSKQGFGQMDTGGRAGRRLVWVEMDDMVWMVRVVGGWVDEQAGVARSSRLISELR